MIAIDTSQSTNFPSGVDGDGTTGREYHGPLPNGFTGVDPDDSALAAVVQAVKHLLENLNPSATRVGIVWFAGDVKDRPPDAGVEVPLTADYSEVEAGLKRILRGSKGFTNMAAGIEASMTQFLRKPALGDHGKDGMRAVLLISDGFPTCGAGFTDARHAAGPGDQPLDHRCARRPPVDRVEPPRGAISSFRCPAVQDSGAI